MTGFVHVLADSINSLSQLRDFPIGPSFCLGAVLVMLFLEHAATSLFSGPKKVQPSMNADVSDGKRTSYGSDGQDESSHLHRASSVRSSDMTGETSIDVSIVDGHLKTHLTSKKDHATEPLLVSSRHASPQISNEHTHKHGAQHSSHGPHLDVHVEKIKLGIHTTEHSHDHGHGDEDGHNHAHVPIALRSPSDLPNSKAVVIAHILEMGIIMHSILIGINLGTTTDPDTLHTLLVAICFHQFFEGVGLGGAIAVAKIKGFKAFFFAAMFTVTTPTGIAIGVGISDTYDENSNTALWVSGLVGAFASGILIYAGLVEMIVEDFSRNHDASASKRLAMYLSVLLGYGCMTVLAIWA